MINQFYLDLLTGWGIGDQYALNKKKEDEVTQGKNYYIGAFCQMGQIGQLSVVIYRLADKVLINQQAKTATKILCNVIPLLSLPTFLLMAAIKQDHYEPFAQRWNEHMPVPLPEELNDQIAEIFKFFAEYAGDMMRVAMIAGTTALLYLEDHAYAGAALTAIMYQTIDSIGWVPRKISLFMEKYMGIVSIVGSIVGGTLVTRVINAAILPTYLFPSFKELIHNEFDNIVNNYFEMETPPLKELNAPNNDNKNMPYDQMIEILHTENMDHFKVVPSHCTKWVTDLANLPKDDAFDKLLDLFDEIDWTGKGEVIKKLLQDDERFIHYVLKQCPTATEEACMKDIQPFLAELATKHEQSEEEFAIDWTRQQLSILIEVLKGDRRVKGLQKDLDDGIENMIRVLPFLLQLKTEGSSIDLEDALLKLAIEGGNYCARAIKRVADQLTRSCLRHTSQKDKGGEEEYDPIKDYELKLKQALQDERTKIVEAFYQEIVQQLQIPGAISKDVHGFDIYRLCLGLGFVPLTEHEKEDLGLIQIGTWEFYSGYRKDMMLAYQASIDGCIHELGEANFGVFMHHLIENNASLTKEQKEEIEDLFLYRNNNQWSVEEAMLRFHLLMTVMLGIQEFHPN